MVSMYNMNISIIKLQIYKERLKIGMEQLQIFMSSLPEDISKARRGKCALYMRVDQLKSFS